MTKKLSILAGVAAFAFPLVGLADEYKSPGDKCPSGTHSEHVTEHSCTSGGGSAGASGGIAHGEGHADHTSCTDRTRDVCRDNKDTGTKERK